MHLPIAFDRNVTLDNTRIYTGSLLSFLTKGDDTGGRFAFIEYQATLGQEPPPHIHEWEHEFFYVLSGEIAFYCEDKRVSAKAGEVVFLPQGKPHAMQIVAPLRALMLVQAAGEHAVGLDKYFLAMSEPATTLLLDEVPTLPAGPPSDEMIGQVIRVAKENGIIVLSSEETAIALPNYPGFGK